MGGRWDHGPTGPILPLEGGCLDAKQAQRGERVPEVPRGVQKRRARIGELEQHEALEPRRVPPQEAVEHHGELRARAQVPQVRMPQRRRVPRVHRRRLGPGGHVVEQLQLRERDPLPGRGDHVGQEKRAEPGECGGDLKEGYGQCVAAEYRGDG